MRRVILFLTVCMITINFISAQTITQTIKGSIVDKESQAVLLGASVILVGTDPLIGTVSDVDGNFRIDNVPVGRYDIQVNFIGYEPYIASNILVGSGKEIILKIDMKESVNQMDEIIITGDKNLAESQNSMATVSARTFSVEDTRRYAGGLDDPARMAASFAGITTGDMQDNAISIRGNAPRGVLWRLEGVEIYNPNHFPGGNVAGGGGVTLFSGQLLANSEFYTGAFPAEYGNALAGVFDMKLRAGNSETREYTIQAGVMGIDLSAEGPFTKGRRASYLFNYRYSTFALLSPILPTDQVPKYQDLSFKLNFPTEKAGTFSLWGIGGYDQNNEPVEYDSTKWADDYDRLKYDMVILNGSAGLTHKYVLGRKSYINTTIAASRLYYDTYYQRVDNEGILQENQFTYTNDGKYTISTFVNHKFSKKLTNRTGIIYDYIVYDIESKAAIDNIPPMVTFIDDNGGNSLFHAYTQSSYQFGENLTINGGLNALYFNLNNNFSIEPRAGIKWNFIPKHSISIGYGNHSQLEEMKIYFAEKQTNEGIVYPNKNTSFSKAHHLVIAYDFLITDNLRLKIEPYYQYLYNIPVVADSSYSMVNFRQEWYIDYELVNEGTATNMGLDVTLEKFFNNGYYYLITGSVFDSKYVGGDGIERNTRYNKNYVVNGLIGKEFYIGKNKNNILGINGKLVYIGGERTSPVDLEASIANQNLQFDWSRAFEEKYPANLFFDLTVTFRRNKEKYSSVWALQIKNVFATSNASWQYFDSKSQTIKEQEMKIVVPVLSYKIEF